MRKNIILLIILVLGLFPSFVVGQVTTYYADLTSGYYKLTYTSEPILIVDAYGNMISFARVADSDYIPVGILFKITNGGRYYIVYGEQGREVDVWTLLGDPTPELSYSVSTGISNYNVSMFYAPSLKTPTPFSLKAEVENPSTAYGGITIYVYCFADMNASINVIGGNADSYVDVWIYEEDTPLKRIYPNSSITLAIKTQQWFRLDLEAYPQDILHVNVTLSSGYIIRYQIPQFRIVILEEASNIQVEVKEAPHTVYAHNFTIVSNETHVLKQFIVPVDISEVKSLITSLNPVVMLPSGDIVPARLVEKDGKAFLIFESWVNGTEAQYTVIWNYPYTIQSPKHVFIESFTADPLLAWSESVKENITRVQYDANSDVLVVYTTSARYVLARKLDFNASVIFAWITANDTITGILNAGNSTYQEVPIALSEFTLDIAGKTYGVTLTETTDKLELSMSIKAAREYSSGPYVILDVRTSNPTTITYKLIIAIRETVPYNVTFDRQLLRLKITLQDISIYYTLPANVGYWTHMVQCVIYYDPTYIPPNVNWINIRLLLPESMWLSQGLCRPALADIAIVDSNGKLIDFWVEPYIMPDGSRGVWIKIPANPQTNMYVVNIFLNNTRLTSSLSTPNAFIQYYKEEYGLGSTWDKDSEGYIVTNNPYINTIVIIPKTSSFAWKLALTPSDYYVITPYSITEVHSLYSETIHEFSGFFVEQTVHFIYYRPTGYLEYYQGKSLLWKVDDLNKPYVWPPIIVGAKDVSFIGLAVLVPYSYSIGTITGGHWGTIVEATPIVQSQPKSPDMWGVMGQVIWALIPLIILAIVFRLIENPPKIIRVERGGGFP